MRLALWFGRGHSTANWETNHLGLDLMRSFRLLAIREPAVTSPNAPLGFTMAMERPTMAQSCAGDNVLGARLAYTSPALASYPTWLARMSASSTSSNAHLAYTSLTQARLSPGLAYLSAPLTPLWTRNVPRTRAMAFMARGEMPTSSR